MLRKTLLFASMLSPLVLLQPAAAEPMPLWEPAVQQVAQVNLNTASAEQLAMKLTGIGLKRAEAIIDLRTKLGSFSDINQLLQIKGIGPRVLELNKERITF
ncbi:ComEA family DNA-binding protein [Pseudidiomarina sp.]|uniref:ComEA family DNA-binding protein n=1 Tax=Pseudidiomarina sp. TaxID=2081707 RepID=UPI00299E3CFE|nr:helix-hairpin-helix domain-containing protein [Pseudidiomarina sp.]MDX1705508.1 helix-hairpin-helix domain-containing protein [Pseudidiomarina sp.]